MVTCLIQVKVCFLRFTWSFIMLSLTFVLASVFLFHSSLNTALVILNMLLSCWIDFINIVDPINMSKGLFFYILW